MADATAADVATSSGKNDTDLLQAYHGCGQGAPVSALVGYTDDFRVEKITHTGSCRRAQQQHQKSIADCDQCRVKCLEHNELLQARAEGATAYGVVNPMSTPDWVIKRSFEPALCGEVGALARGLFESHDADKGRFICNSFREDDQPDLRGFDGFELVQGPYKADQQGRSSMILYAKQVAKLGQICPELPLLIRRHAGLMPTDTVVGHHTVLLQGQDNPGVVFDWHNDTAQENDDTDRGSGKALLTVIHLVFCSTDYEGSAVQVYGRDPVEYSKVGDTMIFAAHCVHKSVAPVTGHCIKLVTTYTQKETLPVCLLQDRTSSMLEAATVGTADTPPSAAITDMVFNTLQAVPTMHRCTTNALNFLMLMAAGAIAMAPWLHHRPSSGAVSLTAKALIDMIKTSSILIQSHKRFTGLEGCKRCSRHTAHNLWTQRWCCTGSLCGHTCKHFCRGSTLDNPRSQHPVETPSFSQRTMRQKSRKTLATLSKLLKKHMMHTPQITHTEHNV